MRRREAELFLLASSMVFAIHCGLRGLRKTPQPASEQLKNPNLISWDNAHSDVTIDFTRFVQVQPFSADFREKEEQSFPFTVTVNRSQVKSFRQAISDDLSMTLEVGALNFSTQGFVYPQPRENRLTVGFSFDRVVVDELERYDKANRALRTDDPSFLNDVARRILLVTMAHVFYSNYFTRIGPVFPSSTEAWQAALNEATRRAKPITDPPIILSRVEYFNYKYYYDSRINESKLVPLPAIPRFQDSPFS